jgi:hypothetical protein
MDTPTYRVRYNTFPGGGWRYDIIDASGKVHQSGITDPRMPDMVQAAETEAHRICDRLNMARLVIGEGF